MLAGLRDLRASEDPQDKAIGQPGGGLHRRRPPPAAGRAAPRPRRRSLTPTPSGSATILRWAWPLAARAAHDLRDTAATGELLALLDSYQPGHLAPMLRAERDLARARLAAGDGDPAAAAAFAAAISGLRELSTPYHLAHGLLDHAEHLTRLRRRRRRRGRHRRSPRHRRATCAASRCWTGPRDLTTTGPLMPP